VEVRADSFAARSIEVAAQVLWAQCNPLGQAHQLDEILAQRVCFKPAAKTGPVAEATCWRHAEGARRPSKSGTASSTSGLSGSFHPSRSVAGALRRITSAGPKDAG